MLYKTNKTKNGSVIKTALSCDGDMAIIIIIIIIIINEKIKVMLSRKRCRGTLQDYKKGEISECQSKLWMNRNIFS